MMLIVPGCHAAASSRSAGPGGTAAQAGTRSPTVAATRTPSSSHCTTSVTLAAVSRPTPSPSRPRPAASSATCTAGSMRLYPAGTCALSTHSRGPIPPPATPLEIIRYPGPGHHSATGSSDPVLAMPAHLHVHGHRTLLRQLTDIFVW